jgi:hypothetical protein
MATVKDIEKKYDDVDGTKGELSAAEVNMIKDTLKKPLEMIPEYDSEEESALLYVIKDLTLQENFKATGTDDIELESSSNFKLDKLKIDDTKIFKIVPENNNTGSVKLTIGANTKTLMFNGEELPADFLVAGNEYQVMYDSENDVFKVVNTIATLSKETEKVVGIETDNLARLDKEQTYVKPIWLTPDGKNVMRLADNIIRLYNNYGEDNEVSLTMNLEDAGMRFGTTLRKDGETLSYIIMDDDYYEVGINSGPTLSIAEDYIKLYNSVRLGKSSDEVTEIIDNEIRLYTNKTEDDNRRYAKINILDHTSTCEFAMFDNDNNRLNRMYLDEYGLNLNELNRGDGGNGLNLFIGEARGRLVPNIDYEALNLCAERGIYIRTPDRGHPNFQSGWEEVTSELRGDLLRVGGTNGANTYIYSDYHYVNWGKNNAQKYGDNAIWLYSDNRDDDNRRYTLINHYDTGDGFECILLDTDGSVIGGHKFKSYDSDNYFEVFNDKFWWGAGYVRDELDRDNRLYIKKVNGINVMEIGDGGKGLLIGRRNNGSTVSASVTTLGHYAGSDMTTPNDIVFIGYQAGYHNTTGQDNVFIGAYSGRDITTGSFNTLVGDRTAVYVDPETRVMVCMGDNAGIYGASDECVFIGGSAGGGYDDDGYDRETNRYSTFIGRSAGGRAMSRNSIMIGLNTGYECTEDKQVLIGYEAGHNIGKDSDSTTGNLCVGDSAGRYVGDMRYSTIIGTRAFMGDSDDVEDREVSYSVAVGYETGMSVTRCTQTVFIGEQAGYHSSSQTGDTYIGYHAGRDSTTGSYNTGVGSYAIHKVTSGSGNTSIGRYSGSYLTTGRSNVFIGYGSGNISDGSNNICIGYSAKASDDNVSNEVTLGNDDNDSYRMYASGWTNVSDARDKTNISPLEKGLEYLSMFTPKWYEWNMRSGAKKDLKGKMQLGFIAQDFLEISERIPEIKDTGFINTSDTEQYMINTDILIPILTKSVQELNEEVIGLKEANKGLLERLERLEELLA